MTHRFPQEGPRDRDLLLVAPREELDRLLERRGAHLEQGNQVLHRPTLRPPPQEPEPGEAAQRLDGRVHPDTEHRHERLVLAIPRQKHDPRPHRLVGRDQAELAVVAHHPPRPGRRSPGEAVEQLGLPVALGAGDPDHLSALQCEAHRPERLALEPVDDENLTALAGRWVTVPGTPLRKDARRSDRPGRARSSPWRRMSPGPFRRGGR